ncbi:general secretion pathway protein H [Mizugakiibacter sediminis]|uniref:Type II secretion system protein H n=1 Tax=Mizugakiibacter sediminis TaxID=1475481 RepID=A0A0K8QQH9_9GAMM|nr:type II secretion system protein [Mizugakiibacter sediminis]GAP67133.1 general secretion pathway protein H [Mizugakiibacter sediminis]
MLTIGRPRRAERPSIPRRAARGFTLLELLAVIVLIGIAISVAAVATSRGLAGARVAAAGRDLAAALRWTRTQAIVQQREQVFELDLAALRYQVPGRDAVALPPGMRVELTTAARERIDARRAGIRFYPDGSSTGGHITLTSGARAWRVDVGWLTGTVSLEDGVPRPASS